MVKKLLIYNSGGGIGDSIQLFPLILSLENLFKKSEIYYLGAHENHYLDKLKEYNIKVKNLNLGLKYFGFRWWHLFVARKKFFKLRLDEFDLIVDCQSKLRNTLMTNSLKVEFIDKMGTDLSVVNAARVSYAKFKDKFEDKDEKLIKFLAEHNHWSPFAHASLQFRIKAPVFVARQLVKHQVGLVWNEISRRYVDYTPELYEPKEWRGRPQNSKQGSDGTVSIDSNEKHRLDMTMEQCKIIYNSLIGKGIAPEQARMVLPQSMMTEWIWSGTLYAFARVCNLRCAKDTQEETREVANQIHNICKEEFPISWKYLKNA